MDNVDPVAFEQYLEEEDKLVRLRDGINVSELLDTSATTFEVDTDYAETEQDYNSYNNENLLKSIETKCYAMGLDDEDNIETTPFQRIASKMTNLTNDGKVKKLEISPGSGPVLPEGAYVTIHYDASVEFGDEPYDSTWLRGQPFSFRLQRGRVILGLDVAVASMKKGEKSLFLIHPDMGYGEYGCPPRIPSNAELLFEVVLMSFIDNAAADAFEALSLEDKQKATFDVILKAAQAEHLTGNGLFKKKSYGGAINKYRKAANLLEKCRLQDEEEEKKQQHLLLKLYVNLAICYNKQKSCRQACIMCKSALDIDPKSAKALFNYGQALIMLSEFDQARNRLIAAKNLEPNNREIVEQLKKLDIKKKAYQDSTRNFSRRMLNNSSEPNPRSTQRSTVSEEFEEAANKFLTELLEDSDRNQIPLPAGLTSQEELCVRQKAATLGLIVRSQDRIGEKLTYICKPEPQ